MLRSQVITLNVVYDDAAAGFSSAPSMWHWPEIVEEGTKAKTAVAVEVLAAGQWKEHGKREEDKF